MRQDVLLVSGAARAFKVSKTSIEETGTDQKPVVVAASAQDGVNAAIKRIPAYGGCEQFKFPSGFGGVASGTCQVLGAIGSVMPLQCLGVLRLSTWQKRRTKKAIPTAHAPVPTITLGD